MPKGDPKVIEVLNEILTAELTAVNQYFVHAKMCKNWGLERLAKAKWDESIDEMKDADRLIDRILYLDGVPNMQRLNPVRVGEDPVEQHKLDLEMELAAVERYNNAIALAREAGKTWLDAVGEVREAVDFARYYASQAEAEISGRVARGVIACISPWNFPVATAVWKIAPALAFGNSVIWKPANLVPASAVALAEIISRQDPGQRFQPSA